MALSNHIIAVVFFFILFDSQAYCNESPSASDNEDTSSIPMIASGKRQHNIMRFGKRPAGGHNLIHFGKREDSKVIPQHSFLYFGKRDNEQSSLPDLLQYLQKNRDNSYKRGHTIMRFGKRGSGNHNFIRFGRRDEDVDYDGYYPDENAVDADKRGGHSMMYFGKRGGHNMMYFGKRAAGHSILSFGKRDDDKRAHSMIHFGKRDEDDVDNMSPEDKRAHAMIHFGKREEDDDAYPEEYKRGSHSMIHFGKREFDEEPIPFYWNPAASEKRQHNLLRFGKKTDGIRKGSHAMIHFGKRDEGKRAHSMIHFGKRSVDQTIDSAGNNKSDSFGNKPMNAVTRMKRDLEDAVSNAEPLVALIRYGNNEDDAPEDDLENTIQASQGNLYHPGELLDHVSFPEEEEPLLPFYPDYQPAHNKEASKNVFLRFG